MAMSVKLMVLGILHDSGESHGYTILRQLNAWSSDTWTNVKPGSVYHALAQLEKKGFAKNRGVKQSKGPSLTTYTITDKGTAELHHLLQQALVSYDQEEFAAGLAWMHLLKRAEVIELAKNRLQAHQETGAFMRTLPRDTRPQTPAKHPEIIESWTALFAAAETSTRLLIEHLEAGSYHFLGE